MPILDKLNEEQVNKYNDFVRTRERASAFQDLNWGKVKSSYIQEAVFVQKNEQIMASMSILIKKIASGFTLMYAPRGPVCDVYDISLVEELMQDVNNLAKRYDAFMFKMDPEVLYDETLVGLYKAKGYFVNSRKSNREQLFQPKYNMILNLKQQTLEEVFDSYSEKTRYNIRLSEKKGVTVRFSRDEKDLKDFYKLSEITAERDGLFVRPYKYFERILEAFPDESQCRIYMAELDGIPLSSAIVLNYGGKVSYLYGASSNENRNCMPNYLLQQEIIKWAKYIDSNEYDFGGVFEINKSNGLYKFKEGFCREKGLTEFIGEIGKKYNKSKYFAFAKAKPCYTKIIRLLHKFRRKPKEERE